MPLFFAFLLRGFNSLIQIISVLFISKNLSLSQFGIYSGFIIILGYFTQLGGFSLMSSHIRKVSIVKMKSQTQILYQIWLYLLITIPIAAFLSLPFF